jgi:hypothetical protein
MYPSPSPRRHSERSSESLYLQLSLLLHVRLPVFPVILTLRAWSNGEEPPYFFFAPAFFVVIPEGDLLLPLPVFYSHSASQRRNLQFSSTHPKNKSRNRGKN